MHPPSQRTWGTQTLLSPYCMRVLFAMQSLYVSGTLKGSQREESELRGDEVSFLSPLGGGCPAGVGQPTVPPPPLG